MHKKRNDIILIIVILIIALVSFLFLYLTPNKNLVAYVYHNDDVVLQIDLKKDDSYIVQGDIGDVYIEVKNSKIRVLQSDCPDHICINQGYISKANQTITCLPNKIYIIIVGNDEVDAIV